MGILRRIALVYMVILLAAASLNYIPGLTDAEGRAFGVFALDIFDDALHVASALWAGIAAALSNRAARIFLRYFGLLYLTDGLLGLATGSGYLDLGIMNHGMLDLPLTFKILANLPHIGGGAFAVFSSVRFATRGAMIRRLWLRVRRALTLRRVLKWSLASLLVATLLLLSPVAYVELGCRGQAATQTYQPLITDPAFQRSEANTYLTYPEWHIVFAYDGLAQALKTGDEHAFDYIDSISSFWSSTCALTRVASQHGGADWDTRSMIHTIGVSFTAEMLAKAAYEETMGRATAWLRGPRKTAQDAVIAGVAADYAAFLRQTPWYQYPFNRKAARALGGAGRSVRSRMGEASRHRSGVRSEGRLCEGHCRCGGRHGAGAAGHPQRGLRARCDGPRAYARCHRDWRARGRRRDRDAALRPVHAHPRRHRSTGRRDPRDRRQRRDHGERDRPRGRGGARPAWNRHPAHEA